MLYKTTLSRLAAVSLAFVFPHSPDANTPSFPHNVPEIEDESYVVVYELDLPEDGVFRNTTAIPYQVDHHLTAPASDRVAYYLELTRDTGTDWIFVSMDAFTSDPKELGLPHHNQNPVLHQRNVQNMNVASNVPGIVTGTFLDTGHIEMWPSNSTSTDAHGVLAAKNDRYDWGDNGTTDRGDGALQIHNPMARQTLLAYNHWGRRGIDDIGIGNRSSGAPDWTGAANAGDYNERKLVILVRPRLADVSFTAFPRDRQLYSRDLDTNRATVPIAGQESFGDFDRVLLRVHRNGDLHFEDEQLLNYQDGRAAFSFDPEIVAELAKYDFELLLDRGGEVKTVEIVRDVVAGDAYLFYGQSNAEAEALSTAADNDANVFASEWLLTFGQNGDNGTHTSNILHWVPAEGNRNRNGPGAIGQWAMVLGRKLIDTHEIPIAILNGSRSAYSIDKLQKDRNDPDNLHDSDEVTRTYNRLHYRAIEAGVAHSARALFYYQGENDLNDAEAHASGFARLREDWNADYPDLEHFYITQLRPGCGVLREDVALRDVQRRLGDRYANTSVMASNALPAHDGCHYLLEGYEELARHHVRMVGRDLYGEVDAPDIDALNPDYVAYTTPTSTELKVVLRNTGATVTFSESAVRDFSIPGSQATVIDGSLSGHVLYLQLSEPADPASFLEYRGHLTEGEWITNANGVGMLSFAEPILASEEMNVTLSSPAATRRAEVGEEISIEATAERGATGPVTRMALYANGVPQVETDTDSLSTVWQPTAKGAYRLTVRAFDKKGNFSEKSIGVLAEPTPLPAEVGTGLQVWLKAETGVTRDSSGGVSEWLDQSGHNHDAIQIVSSARPRYLEGLYGPAPGIQFDGNDYLRSISGMPTGNYTKVVRFSITSDDPVYYHNLVSAAEPGTSTSNRDHALYVPLLKPTLHHNGDFAQSDQEVELEEKAVVIATYDAATMHGQVFLNGTLTGSGTAEGRNTTTPYQLGAYLTPADYFLHGSLAEVLIYDRVLTDDERESIGEYLDEKTRTPFELWQKESFAAGDGTSRQDPDGDGLPTLLEYALGLNPTRPDASLDARLPRLVRDGDRLAVVYQHPMDRPDAVLELQRSTDFETWSTVSGELAGIDDNLATIRYVLDTPASTAFFRLRTTVPAESTSTGNDRVSQ